MDVYWNTNHNQSGTVANCSDGASPLDFSSFDIVVHSSGSGSVAYNSFTPSSQITTAGLSVVNPLTVAGNDAGVNGTPAFFINGRMLSGAQPFDEFKRVIDEELALKRP